MYIHMHTYMYSDYMQQFLLACLFKICLLCFVLPVHLFLWSLEMQACRLGPCPVHFTRFGETIALWLVTAQPQGNKERYKLLFSSL